MLCWSQVESSSVLLLESGRVHLLPAAAVSADCSGGVHSNRVSYPLRRRVWWSSQTSNMLTIWVSTQHQCYWSSSVVCRVRVEVWLAWLYVGSLVLMRVIVVVSVVHIVLFTKGNCDPTVMAKVRVLLSTLVSGVILVLFLCRST